MAKKKYIFIISALLVLVIAACFFLFIKDDKSLTGKKQLQYPDANIILIVIDSLRADHLGCYGYHRDTSPEIDKLASEGIIFKNMLAQSSWTRPGTASILTGLYPRNHGANTREDRLVDKVDLLPEILEKHGYISYGFVANGNAGAGVGFNQGYKKFIRFGEKVRPSNPNIHVRSDIINRRISEFIQQLGPGQTSKNFIYIHYADPHAPYIPKEKHFSRSNKITFTTEFFRTLSKMSRVERLRVKKEMINAYDDEILFGDKMIGNLIQILKKNNMYANSIIIITSDHGEEFFEHGRRGHGVSLYQEQLKVPLIIHLPDRIHWEIDEIANQVDIAPTLLSLLKIPVPQHIDGINLLNNKKPSYRYSFAELNLNKMVLSSVQTSRDKLIEGFHHTFPKYKGKRWFKEKAVFETTDESLELIIKSFYKKRTIRVLVDGNIVKQLVITPKKQIINISLPPSESKKMVTIKSLTPCQSPKDLGINKNHRCFGFLLIDSRNVKVNNILNEPKQEYYILTKDTAEKNNRYYQKQFKKAIVVLRKVVKGYFSDECFTPSGKKPVTYNKEQLKVLKTLGYIQGK